MIDRVKSDYTVSTLEIALSGSPVFVTIEIRRICLGKYYLHRKSEFKIC